MSLNNILQKNNNMKNDILTLENKTEFPHFSNFLNRRMNYFLNLNEEIKPNFYSNLGYPNNINQNKDQIPNRGRPKKRNKNSFKEPELKPFMKEPESTKALKEIPEEKNSMFEENSIPINELDGLKPLFPMKNPFWELGQNKESMKEEKKEEESHEKAENICKEIAALAKDILQKMNKCNVCKNFEKEIEIFDEKFQKINENFLNRAKNDNNFELFKKIEDFLNENLKITGYELFKYKFCESFLEFMFEGGLPNVYEMIQVPKNLENVDLYINSKSSEPKMIMSDMDLNIEMSQSVQMSIMRKIIVFFLYFSKHSLNDSKGFLHFFFCFELLKKYLFFLKKKFKKF